MFIPMGTVMTVCMLVVILLAFLARHIAPSIRTMIGIVTIAAGSWNVFWYALRNLSEFWGLMALASGALMLAISALVLFEVSANKTLKATSVQRWRNGLAVVLIPFALFYGYTIYSL